MNTNTFKIILVGDAGVGKTTLVNRHTSGNFEKRYIATLGVDVTPLRFKTNYGEYVLNIWDCAGSEKFSGLGDGYYVEADAAICMFSLDSKITMENIPKWIRDVKRMCENIPTIIAGSKYDDPNLEVNSKMFGAAVRDLGYPMLEISSKSNYQYDKPFLHLLRILTKHEDLVIM